MKCEKCNHLVRTSYEYGEYACELFGDEPPCFLDTGEGCKLRWNEAKKLSRLVDSVHYGTYQWYGRTPTKEEAKRILLSAGYDWWKTTPNGMTKTEYEAECFLQRRLPQNPRRCGGEEMDYIDVLKQGFKEGVEALAIQIKERIHYNENISQDTDDCLCEEIDNLCSELLDGRKTGDNSKVDEIPVKNDNAANSGDECVSYGKYAGEGRHICVNCEAKGKESGG